MKNTSFMQVLDHGEHLQGEVDGHGLGARLLNSTGLGKVDDVQQGSQLLVVGDKYA